MRGYRLIMTARRDFSVALRKLTRSESPSPGCFAGDLSLRERVCAPAATFFRHRTNATALSPVLTFQPFDMFVEPAPVAAVAYQAKQPHFIGEDKLLVTIERDFVQALP
jgi:hypothetical protein